MLDKDIAIQTERRRGRRFPIEREVHYKTLNRRFQTCTGNGKTLNISSSGVLFTSDYHLPVGMRVEVSIDWPAHLNERCPLNLVIQGCVVRYPEGQLALNIQKYEFRTQGGTARTSAHRTDGQR